jgi:hypothetical protein
LHQNLLVDPAAKYLDGTPPRLGNSVLTLIKDILINIVNQSITLSKETHFVHTHPIGLSVEAQKKVKKSGWNGSLTLPLSRGEKKKYQTNRIQTQRSPTALQSDSATSGSETCARDRCGFHGANFQSMESRCEHALCTTDPCHRP